MVDLEVIRADQVRKGMVLPCQAFPNDEALGHVKVRKVTHHRNGQIETEYEEMDGSWILATDFWEPDEQVIIVKPSNRKAGVKTPKPIVNEEVDKMLMESLKDDIGTWIQEGFYSESDVFECLKRLCRPIIEHYSNQKG